ncbi:MAG: hypothetical protein GF329_07930 [Candidatus Lokiarchaeota archaeon]|nr:hypothetical protein [Candidatus Lokiarchaeota archaeon]
MGSKISSLEVESPIPCTNFILVYLMEKFLEIIKKNKPNLIIITSHTSSDPDGLCSAVALRSLLLKLGINSKIEIVIDSYTVVTKKIIDLLDLKSTTFDEIDENKVDLIILVDVNNIEIIGKAKKLIMNEIPYFIIDHHKFERNKRYPSSYEFIKDNYTSTAEVIYELFEYYRQEIDIKTAKNLLLGIIYDTKHFLIANNRTFHIVNKLLSKKLEYKEIIGLLRYPMSKSEKIARLKAAKRLRIHKLGIWVCVVSEVSSYEASASRGLLRLGADIAIVKSIKNDELRISIRSKQEFYKKTNISLTDICDEILEDYKKYNVKNLTCGGHSTAAGFNGKAYHKKICDKIIKIIKNKLNSLSKK